MFTKWIARFTMIGAIAALQACATASSDIRPSYVSPLQFQPLTCQQLAAEAARVSAHASELAGVQDSKRSDDQINAGIGIIVFWPTLLMVKGDGATAAELARLRGEYEAIEKASIEKNCGTKFVKPTT
jgi:hypothetical protein